MDPKLKNYVDPQVVVRASKNIGKKEPTIERTVKNIMTK